MLTKAQRDMVYNVADAFLQWQKGPLGSVATLAFVTDDGVLHTCSNTACHAGLRSADYYIKSKGNIIAIISGVQAGREKWDKQDRLMFFDWMINDSPYKNCFLNKDAEEVEEKFWIMNPEAPCNLLTNAAFATRHMTEWPKYFESFLAMVKQGVPKTKAFFFSYYLRKQGDGWGVNTTEGGWHQPFPLDRGKDYYKNFINATPEAGKVGEPYQKKRSYSYANDIWGDGNFQVANFKRIKPIEARKVDLTRLNIFWKPSMGKEQNFVFTTEQLPDFVAQAEKLYAA